ncbi:4Fe-4S dicluster domain-containing protein [Thermoproteota archaeon]
MYALLVDIDKCTGCMVCVMECSFYHEQAYSRSLSRIRIKRNEEKELSVPLMCEQCGVPACVYACPVDALTYNGELHIPVVDDKKCNTCGLCISECPFEAIQMAPEKKKVLICDLCDGDPICVKVCLPKAILYETIGNSVLIYKVKAMDKKLRLLEKEFKKKGGV